MWQSVGGIRIDRVPRIRSNVQCYLSAFYSEEGTSEKRGSAMARIINGVADGLHRWASISFTMPGTRSPSRHVSPDTANKLSHGRCKHSRADGGDRGGAKILQSRYQCRMFPRRRGKCKFRNAALRARRRRDTHASLATAKSTAERPSALIYIRVTERARARARFLWFICAAALKVAKSGNWGKNVFPGGTDARVRRGRSIN